MTQMYKSLQEALEAFQSELRKADLQGLAWHVPTSSISNLDDFFGVCARMYSVKKSLALRCPPVDSRNARLCTSLERVLMLIGAIQNAFKEGDVEP